MSTFTVPDCECPVCNKKLDQCTNAGEESANPVPGDVTVCFGCTSTLLFNEDLTVRLPTPAELFTFDDDTVELLNSIKLEIRSSLH